MSKRKYEEYIENGCHPVGYNEPCQSYYFGQTSVDLLLDKIDQLKQQLAESFTEEDVEGLIEDREKTIKFLQKELAEKTAKLEFANKEIERLKVFEKAYYFNQTQVSQESMDLLLQNAYQVHNEIQLAIQELAEVERLLYESHYKEIDGKYYAEYEDINNLIDSRIKALEELKGEQT